MGCGESVVGHQATGRFQQEVNFHFGMLFGIGVAILVIHVSVVVGHLVLGYQEGDEIPEFLKVGEERGVTPQAEIGEKGSPGVINSPRLPNCKITTVLVCLHIGFNVKALEAGLVLLAQRHIDLQVDGGDKTLPNKYGVLPGLFYLVVCFLESFAALFRLVTDSILIAVSRITSSATSIFRCSAK